MKNKKMIHNPYSKFKGWLRENGLTYKDIAELIGNSVPTVNAKINGQSDFSLAEVNIIINKYGLDSAIFFTNNVA